MPPPPPPPPPLYTPSYGHISPGFLVIAFLLVAVGVAFCCFKHHVSDDESPFRRFANSMGWSDVEVEKHRKSLAAVAPAPEVATTSQEFMAAAMADIEDGDAQEAADALRRLNELAGDAHECELFMEVQGPRVVLERLRVCAPSDQALHEEVLIKLASASSLHQAARGDEAEYDANMAARMRTFRFVFVTLFTLFFAGLLMFGLAAFYNGNHYETKAANKHSRDGLLVFLWFVFVTLGLAILATSLGRLLFLVYFGMMGPRLKEQDLEVERLLADGSLRLLSVPWLKAQTDMAVLPRRQELPAEAFVSPQAAQRLYASRTRSVGVLSYRWLRPEHPDPCGQRLATTRSWCCSACPKASKARFPIRPNSPKMT